MLAVIVRNEAGPEALGRSLAPLVRGVVEGLVSEVLIVARPDDRAAAEVAEASGAVLVRSEDWSGGLGQAASLTRADLLLVLDAGLVLGEAFWPALADALAAGPPARPLVTAASGFHGLASRILGRPGYDQAVILPKRLVSGDPWRFRLRPRPVQLQAGAFRVAPRLR